MFINRSEVEEGTPERQTEDVSPTIVEDEDVTFETELKLMQELNKE